MLEELEELIRNSNTGLLYREVTKRTSLLPIILKNLTPVRDKQIVLDKTKELLEEALILNLDILEYICLIYRGKYYNSFVLKYREQFDKAMTYVINGNKEIESIIEPIYLKEADKIARQATNNYLKELFNKE